MTITTAEHGIRNSVSIHRAKLAPPTWEIFWATNGKYAKRAYREISRLLTHWERTDYKRWIRWSAAKVQSRLYCVWCVQRNIVQYVVCSYRCTSADETDEPLEHIPEHFIIHYCRLVKKTSAVLQRCRRDEANRKRKVPKYPTVVER